VRVFHQNSPFIRIIITILAIFVQAPAPAADRKNIFAAPCKGDPERGSGADSSAKFFRSAAGAGACTMFSEQLYWIF